MYDESVYRATHVELSPAAGGVLRASYLGDGSTRATHPDFTISA